MTQLEIYKLGDTDGYTDKWRYYTTSKEAADWWDAQSAYHRIQKETFTVHESLEELQDFVSGEAKRRALAKLTPEEKKALGLI